MAIDSISLTTLAIVEAMQAVSKLFAASPASLIDEYGDEFVFTAILDETESSSNRVSQHAIEGVDNIADHVHPEPGKLTIQTRIADDNCILNYLAGLAGSALLGIENKTATEKIQLLKDWRETGRRLTYSGPSFLLDKNYDIVEDSLVIGRLDIKRTSQQGMAPFVTIQLEKVLVVEAIQSDLNIPDFMKQTSKKGKAATKNASKGKSKQSTASKIIG